MASVKSPLRSLLKPILHKLAGPLVYDWFQVRAKVRDIDQKLVEEPELRFLEQALSPASVCFDVGANFAYYTVRLAQLCPQGRVYAFEPIPRTFAILRRIVEHYQLQNVELYQKGVGAKNESLEFSVPLQEVGTHSAGQAHLKNRNNELSGKEKFHPFAKQETFSCEVVALDSFFPRLPRLDFVKIDIEGAELFALRGMEATIRKHKPLLLLEICSFFLNGFGLTEEDLRSFIKGLDYEFFVYEGGALRSYTEEHFVDRNYILIPKNKASFYAGWFKT